MINDYDDTEDMEVANFKFKLNTMRSPFNDYPSWNETRLSAFMKVVEKNMISMLPHSKTNYYIGHDEEQVQSVFISVKPFDKEKITTSIPVGMIMSSECPTNLPELIATEFYRQLT